ncbi:hypothetical protein KKF84_14880, partial [Myxococcota bacterium]|nr:hypothetical protein [Myxococcota bacterium]
MDDNSLNNKPEPLLRFINPTSNPGISFDKPGNFRTFATLFSLSLILIGGAFLTSWLVFRQSKNRRDRHKVQGILKKTRLDTVKNYHSAISTLTRQNKVLGKTASSILQGEFSIILALAHDIPDYVVKGNYLATITGKRNIHQRELLKSMTSITRLLIQKRFQEAAMLIEQEMVSFPRSHLHLYALALARMELGNWEAANSSVSMAIELGQKPIPYRLLQAIIERKRGKKAHAAS